MKDENQGSGSSVMVLVLAVLGGLLLVGCCGGVIVVGGGMVFYRARAVEVEAMEAQDQNRAAFERASSEMEEKLRQDMEAIKIPEAPPSVLPPESVPPPETPPSEGEK